jgi:hypothetical protein
MQVENIYQKMWCKHSSTKTKFEDNIFLIYSKTCGNYCAIFLSFQVEGKLGLGKMGWTLFVTWKNKNQKKKKRRNKAYETIIHSIAQT